MVPGSVRGRKCAGWCAVHEGGREGLEALGAQCRRDRQANGAIWFQGPCPTLRNGWCHLEGSSVSVWTGMLKRFPCIEGWSDPKMFSACHKPTVIPSAFLVSPPAVRCVLRLRQALPTDVTALGPGQHRATFQPKHNRPGSCSGFGSVVTCRLHAVLWVPFPWSPFHFPCFR